MNPSSDGPPIRAGFRASGVRRRSVASGKTNDSDIKLMEIALIVLGTKANKKEVRLQLPATIGRSRNASLTVGHPMISRKHCELSMQDDVIVVQDLGSLNGTIVNGESIGKAELPEGGQFSIGPIIFQVAYDPDTVAPEATSAQAKDESAPSPEDSGMVDLYDEDDELGLVDLESDLPPHHDTPLPEVARVAIPTAVPVQGAIPMAVPVQGAIPMAMPVQGGVPTAMPVQGSSPTREPDNPPPSNSNIAKSENMSDTDLDDFLNGFQL